MSRLQRSIMLREPTTGPSETKLIPEQPLLPPLIPDEPKPRRLFDVHIFFVQRYKVPEVIAATYNGAISRAHEMVNLQLLFPDWTEEITEYTVDVAGDEDYQQTRHFDGDPIGTRQLLERLVGLYSAQLTSEQLAVDLQLLACEAAAHLRTLGEPPPAAPA